MHFIPFVTLLLVVLSLSMTSFFQDYGTLAAASSHLTSYQTALRETRNQMEKDIYTANLPKDKREKKKETQKKKNYDRSDKEYKTHRDQKLSENSKLNIALLIKEEHPFLENTLSSLIDRLYSEAPFFKKASRKEPDLARKLVNELIVSLKAIQGEEPIDIHLIRFKNASLQEVWYHMLKGSETYNLQTKEGIIPFRDLVTVHPDAARRAISSKKAPTVLLQAAFGEEFAARVIEAEREKFYHAPEKQSPLSPQEFQTLLHEFHLPSYDKYIQAQYKKTLEKTTRKKDPRTGIPAKMVAQKHRVETNPKEATKAKQENPETTPNQTPAEISKEMSL